MSHIRQQVRDQVASTISGLGLTGTRVYKNRLYPLERTELPCLLVMTDAEEIEQLTANRPAVLQRMITVRIQGVAKANTDLDNTLDTISQQVETAIYGATMSAVKSIELTGASINIDSIGEQPVGMVTMDYKVIAMTKDGSPQTAL